MYITITNPVLQIAVFRVYLGEVGTCLGQLGLHLYHLFILLTAPLFRLA